jgi:hypothetical protein
MTTTAWLANWPTIGLVGQHLWESIGRSAPHGNNTQSLEEGYEQPA